MATTQATADFITEQLQKAGDISTRKMFGEYALYCDGRTVGFICDDQLFVKPTEAAKNFLDGTQLAPAYPGSKDYHRVSEDKLDDREWLCDFIRQTADLVPMPKPKKPKK